MPYNDGMIDRRHLCLLVDTGAAIEELCSKISVPIRDIVL